MPRNRFLPPIHELVLSTTACAKGELFKRDKLEAVHDPLSQTLIETFCRLSKIGGLPNFWVTTDRLPVTASPSYRRPKTCIGYIYAAQPPLNAQQSLLINMVSQAHAIANETRLTRAQLGHAHQQHPALYLH